jgi:hypothetical protein
MKLRRVRYNFRSVISLLLISSGFLINISACSPSKQLSKQLNDFNANSLRLYSMKIRAPFHLWMSVEGSTRTLRDGAPEMQRHTPPAPDEAREACASKYGGA